MNNIAELDIKSQELELIKKLIEENPYYEGNEDFLGDFCKEVYSKSYLLFNSVKNYDYLSSYLKKIVNTSIISILKANARTKSLNLKPKTEFMTKNSACAGMLQETSQINNQAARIKTAYDIYKLEEPFTGEEDYTPKGQELANIVQLLEFVSSENTDKRYTDIFVLRYIKNYAPDAIAFHLKISEAEVTKRLLDLAEIINANINLKK